MKGVLTMPLGALEWKDGELTIIDQTLLPLRCERVALQTAESVWEAIKTLQVRGAPAIGLCAAFGVLVALKEKAPKDGAGVLAAVEEATAYLATSRPTAVNLFYALDRMRAVAHAIAHEKPGITSAAFRKRLEAEAQTMFEEDRRACTAIADYGASLIRDGDGVLTHCNTGALVASDYGTALGAMFRAHEKGKKFRVYADETRPLLQGARLTAWELMQAGIDVTLICDNMAALVMREGKVQLAIVGADRIAANGDTANKVGTYSVAIVAKAHGVPFYVAAPLSTFDFDLEDGSGIPIEERKPEEITRGFGKQTAPDGVRVYNPAFDVTPADLIAGIVTEKGILRPPYRESIDAARDE